MKIVYAFTCHRMTNPLKHTVNYLSSFSENIILIHVDKKSNLEDFKSLKKSNVHFIPNRIDITWGDETLMLATIELMKSSSAFDYDYFILLSGDDIPLKTDSEFKEFLNQYNQYDFLYFDKKMSNKKIKKELSIYIQMLFIKETRS